MNFTQNVKSPMLPEVKAIVDSIKVSDDFKRYSTNIKNWLSPIIDLSDFYVYPTNGITEGLNYFMGTSEYNIFRSEGDYEWVDNVKGRSHPTIYYLSVPSSIDGNFKEIPIDKPVALDIAYAGTTKIQKIPMSDNIKYVFYSLSKPFGVNQYRTGWLFTRKFDPKLYILVYKSYYYNYYAHELAERIIQTFPVDYIYNKFYNKQIEICKKYNLEPSDSVWIATSTDLKYKKFIRKKVARLCLTEFFND
jgi:hypothetical protein